MWHADVALRSYFGEGNSLPPYYDNDLEKHDFNDNERVKKGMFLLSKAMGLPILQMTKFRVSREQRQMTLNSLFSFLTWTPFLVMILLGNWATLYKLNGLEQS